MFKKSILLFFILISYLSFPSASAEYTIKNTNNDGSEKTHGEYQNNTNACASCHQTHTGTSKDLIFRDGVYNTCIACHDGTLGFYNIFGQSSAGTFGGTDEGNMSIHTANGTVKHNAAPGGNYSADEGNWTNEFNCASCHSPHGSYSDRLLHYNPNGMGNIPKTEGGIGAVNVPVVQFSDLSTFNEYLKYPVFPVRGTASELGYDVSDELPSNATVIQLFEASPTSYTTYTLRALNDPWLNGYSFKIPNNEHWTRFYKTATSDFTIVEEANGIRHYSEIVDEHDQKWNSNIKFVWNKGYVYEIPWDVDGDPMTPDSTTLDQIISGDVARAYVVKLDLMPIFDPAKDNGDGIYQPGEEKTFGNIIITTSNQRALFDGETNSFSVNIQEKWGIQPGSRVSGWGVAMTNFCATCHTDYLARDGTEEGTWSKAYRHSTNFDVVTCVRCHFAHGTDISVMRDSEYRTRDEATLELFDGDIELANAYMLDKNPSSALKRYTNMSACWGCHTDSISKQFRNTTFSSYELNSEEGKANWPPESN